MLHLLNVVAASWPGARRTRRIRELVLDGKFIKSLNFANHLVCAFGLPHFLVLPSLAHCHCIGKKWGFGTARFSPLNIAPLAVVVDAAAQQHIPIMM